ncbi:hypothetical protein HK098_000316 [Nowakowskiella sp. JEL0407]|nr:hypothetical protein HK098_000316 [Nowakowskiella sp. JEL0407]
MHRLLNQYQQPIYSQENQVQSSAFNSHDLQKRYEKLQQELQFREKLNHKRSQEQMMYLNHQTRGTNKLLINQTNKPLEPVTSNAVATAYSYCPYYYHPMAAPAVPQSQLSAAQPKGHRILPSDRTNSVSSAISDCSTIYDDREQRLRKSASVASLKVNNVTGNTINGPPQPPPRAKTKLSINTTSRYILKNKHSQTFSTPYLSSSAAPSPAKTYPSPPSPSESLSDMFRVSKFAIDQYVLQEDAHASSEFDEYGGEITTFMKELEKKSMPDPEYLQKQLEISVETRAQLIYELINFQINFGLTQETLYLAINYLDRFCTKRLIRARDYHFVGMTCMWVAAKYEETQGRLPTLKNLMYECNSRYSEANFTYIEHEILQELKFNMGNPTAEAFLKLSAKVMTRITPQKRAVARYIMELATVQKGYLCFLPSEIALSALILADEILGAEYLIELDECGQFLLQCLVFQPPQIYNKYKGKTHLKASQIVKYWYNMIRSKKLTTVRSYSTLNSPKEENYSPATYYDSFASNISSNGLIVACNNWINGIASSFSEVSTPVVDQSPLDYNIPVHSNYQYALNEQCGW